MTSYPSYVPQNFIDYYESELFNDDKCKEIASRFIFEEKMAFVWRALNGRANEWASPFIFYQQLIVSISEALKGPSEWELLTKGERGAKINRIASLAEKLMAEIKDTPFDVMMTEYINEKVCIDWAFDRALNERAKNRMKFHLERFCKLQGREYTGKENELEIASAWSQAGIVAPPISNMLIDLNKQAIEYVDNPVIKRKSNPKKTYFVRSLANFFEEHHGQKLYEITAIISTIFLGEEVSRDDAVSITRQL